MCYLKKFLPLGNNNKFNQAIIINVNLNSYNNVKVNCSLGMIIAKFGMQLKFNGATIVLASTIYQTSVMKNTPLALNELVSTC